MIHQLLNLTRPLFIFDTETTGVDPKSDRIVNLGFEQWGPEGLVKEWKTLVNPGGPIPAGASKVHGIYDAQMELCRECGGYNDDVAPDRCKCPPVEDGGPGSGFKPVFTFKQLAPNLAKGFSNCDFGGKNVRFDLRILSAEMARAGVQWSYVGARIVDAERLEQLAVPRTLSHLYEKYTGEKLAGAHDAMNDVKASTTVIVKQLETHPTLPRDLDTLHRLQWPGWLCDGGEFKLVEGIATCQFGKWRGKPMKNIPLSYYDWIIGSDFPADVKALAAAAKLGKFPDGAS